MAKEQRVEKAKKVKVKVGEEQLGQDRIFNAASSSN